MSIMSGKNKRGYLTTQSGYLTMALGIALAVLSAALYLTYGLYNNCVQERAALHQQIADLEVKVEEQNKKVEEWAAEARKRTKTASEALEKERLRGRSLQTEIARLKTATATPRASLSSCPAGDAVKVIREGLLP